MCIRDRVHQRWRLVPVIEDFQNNSSARMPTRDQRIIGGGTSENSLETFRRLAALDGEYFLCMAAGDTLSEDFLSKAIDILDRNQRSGGCLLYTSDAADDLTRVDVGGRLIIKKK